MTTRRVIELPPLTVEEWAASFPVEPERTKVDNRPKAAVSA